MFVRQIKTRPAVTVDTVIAEAGSLLEFLAGVECTGTAVEGNAPSGLGESEAHPGAGKAAVGEAGEFVFFDLEILFETVPTVLFGRGAY